LLSPALVQGDQAPESIVAAIQRVVQDGRAEVLIVSRGGGAVEDMVCFNDERVVRAIADCPIPVISGIGHQRDESLADLAADVCAHTPTAAAEQAVPQLADLQAAHQEQLTLLQQAVQSYLDAKAATLQRLGERLRKAQVPRQVRQERQALAWLRQRVLQSTSSCFNRADQQCQFLAQTLVSLDPAAVLRRGYAVVRQTNGAIARNANDLNLGQTVYVQLGQGYITAEVTAVDAPPVPKGVTPDIGKPDIGFKLIGL